LDDDFSENFIRDDALHRARKLVANALFHDAGYRPRYILSNISLESQRSILEAGPASVRTGRRPCSRRVPSSDKVSGFSSRNESLWRSRRSRRPATSQPWVGSDRG